MADELFDGVYAVNMSLAEAIRRKILPLPVYVTSWYSFRGDIEQLEIKAEQSGNPRLKNALLGKIRKAKSMIAELDVGIDKIFEKHIPNKAGKFIVFCPNVESLQRMVSECDSWFAKVNRDIHKYKVYAQNSASDKQFEDFRNDKDGNALKLLFCIDMLNEGVHFDDIDGVIMLRATQSANVFYQQLGRALACSESNKHPVIFDIVKINSPWDKRDEQWNKTFELLKKYYADHGSLPETSVTVDGVHIGVWYRAQFQLYQKGLLQSDRLDRFNSANVPLTSPRSARKNGTWAKYYDSYMEYLTRYGHHPNSTERYNDLELRKWRSLQLKKLRLGQLSAEQTEKLKDICSDVK